MNPEIINYIKEARQHGFSEQAIKSNLLDAGWEAQMVEDNFAHLKALDNQPPANVAEKISLPQTKPLPTAHQPIQPQAASRPPQAQLADFGVGQNFPASAPIYRQKKIWLALVGLLVLAGGASAAYFYIYASPERVWKKFSQLAHDKILSSDFNFSYRDKGEASKEDLAGFPFADLKLEFNGKGYADTTDQDNPQSSSEISYTFASGNTNFSTGFEYKLIGKKFYMNVGSNPFLEGIFSALGKGKKIQWVVLDIDELQKKANEQSSADAKKFKEVFNPQFVDELKKIWEDAIFVKMDKLLGREKQNGKITLHFANRLDKAAIKTTLTAMLDKIIGAFKQTGENIKEDDINSAKMVINALVDKLEMKQFETWIGMLDFKLYKVKIQTSAPSIISAIKTASAPQEKSRDARRLADVRQLASALELYFNDKNRYPDSKDGQPVGVSPAYIGLLPTAPVPADGNCTDYYNTYWYEVKNSGQSYEMTFCLGNDTGGYKAGILKLTSAGIQNLEGCPSTPDKCYKNALADNTRQQAEKLKTQEEKIRETVGKISFDAEIQIEANYKDYGLKKDVQAPEGAFDLLELIDKQNQPQQAPL